MIIVNVATSANVAYLIQTSGKGPDLEQNILCRNQAITAENGENT